MTEDLVYPLISIVERIDLAKLFPLEQPLEVELGCGDASFLVQYAAQHPERNFIGVERLLGRIRKLDRKGRRAGLSNLRGLRIESAYFLEYLLPTHSVEVIHVYFPDPWPKRKHQRHRLISERFVTVAHSALVTGGMVYLRTDNPEYYARMLEAFETSQLFRRDETPEELASLHTDFESEFTARGIKTLRAAYRRL